MQMEMQNKTEEVDDKTEEVDDKTEEVVDVQKKVNDNLEVDESEDDESEDDESEDNESEDDESEDDESEDDESEDDESEDDESDSPQSIIHARVERILPDIEHIEYYGKMDKIFRNVREQSYVLAILEKYADDNYDNSHYQMIRGGLASFIVDNQKDYKVNIEDLLVDMENLKDYKDFLTNWAPKAKCLTLRETSLLRMRLFRIKENNLRAFRWVCGFSCALSYAQSL